MASTVAHIAGVPAEEALLPLLSGLGAGAVLVRAWVGTRARGTRGRSGARDARDLPGD
jgi:hypothetical protein